MNKNPQPPQDRDLSDDNKIWLQSSLTLRKTVGAIGILLPLLLYFILYFSSAYIKPLPSISHYFFTKSGTAFVCTLSLLGVFLIIYKGKEKIDLVMSLIAGIAALFIAFFPTDNLTTICCDHSKFYATTIISVSKTREIIHYVAAASFFLSLAYMSFFLFTKSNLPPHLRSQNKKLRNKLYRICAILMVLSIITILLWGFLEIFPKDIYEKYQLTFWLEVIAIESFGFSWLVKGETLFKDE